MKNDAQAVFGMASTIAGFPQHLRFISHAWLLGCAAFLWAAPRSEVLFRELYRNR